MFDCDNRRTETHQWHYESTHFDSEDDYRTGCRNVNHIQQQSYSGLRSPGQSCSTNLYIFLFIKTWSVISTSGVFTINTKHPGGNLAHKHKTTRYKVYSNELNRQKRLKIHHLKRQPIFSEAFQTEWREPFDYPNRNFCFFHVNGKYPWISIYSDCYR